MDMWSPAGAGSEHVERARTIAPQIEACADQIERERRLVEPVLDALFEAGMFRLLLPRSLHGAEVDPVTFVTVIEEIAKADASTAWCLCQASGCSMSAAYLPPDVASDVFDKDPRSVLAWGPGPDARAIAVEGGYRVTGMWSFASALSWHDEHTAAVGEVLRLSAASVAAGPVVAFAAGSVVVVVPRIPFAVGGAQMPASSYDEPKWQTVQSFSFPGKTTWLKSFAPLKP